MLPFLVKRWDFITAVPRPWQKFPDHVHELRVIRRTAKKMHVEMQYMQN